MKKLALVLIFALTACAGTPFKWSAARQIQPGMSTQQVTEMVGTPNTVKAQGDVLIYVWVYVNTLNGTTRTLRVDFRDGKAISAPPIPPEFQD